MRLHLRFLPALLVFSTLSIPGTKAVDLYNNLTATSGPPVQVSPTTNQALSFQTSASSMTLTDVVIPIWNFNSAVSGTIEVSLYDATGSSNAPGSFISTLGTTPVSGFSSAGFQNYSISGLNVSLSPSTYYWVVMSGPGVNPLYGLGQTTSSSGTGASSLGQATFSSGSWSVLPSFFIIGSVSATAAVPEPSTYALATLATATLALLARRRKAASV